MKKTSRLSGVLMTGLAGLAAAQTTLYFADFESSTDPSVGSADYNVSGTTAVATRPPTSSSPDPTLGTAVLLLDRNSSGGLDARLDLASPASLSGGDTVTVAFDVAARRTNGIEKSTLVTGFDLAGDPVFALVLGDADCFGNGASDRQRPGYETAGGGRQVFSGAGAPGNYWWGNGGDGTDIDVTKDAHFELTIGASNWTVDTTDQNGVNYVSGALPSFDGTSHTELAYLRLSTFTGSHFGLYWDNFEVEGTPTGIDTYVWTGSASGGDGSSLFGESNWTRDGDNTTVIPQIDAGVPVNADLVVNSGNPGGGGASGPLDLGAGSLTLTGGNIVFGAAANRAIHHGDVTVSGGSLFTEGFVALEASLSGGSVELFGAIPLDGSTVDFPSGSSAELVLAGLSRDEVVAGLLPSFTVAGQPAVNGENLAVVASGAGSEVVPFFGPVDGDEDGMNDAWELAYFGGDTRDGSGDFDGDGLDDLGEFNAGTDPTDTDSDGDLLADGAETVTDPADPDSDGDGNPDGFEVAKGLDPADPASRVAQPNILYIFCDDLGYGDLGVLHQNQRLANGQKAHQTPFLDQLAGAGLILDRHYCPAPVCAPSRGSLLTGMHQGHANVRNNQFDKALENNHTLATVLNAAGYRTALIGKYGLQGGGGTPAAWPAYPTKRGFDEFFGYVRHGDGHTHYPDHVTDSRGTKELYDNNLEISDDLDKCFTPDLFTARAKKLIIEEANDGDQEPFFIYLTYDTPHAALQIPTVEFPGWNSMDPDDDSGFGVAGGVQWLGAPGSMINTATGTIDSYRHPAYTGNGWTDVEERFATLVRRMDDCVGDLRKTLKDLGIEDQTLIVFSADNGPHTEDYLTNAQTTDGSDYRPTSFQSYGPFEGIKRDCWEGGIRQPTVVCWPGTIAPGGVNEMPAQLHDWLATLSAVAGWTPPARTDGTDLSPTLTGVGTQSTPTTYIEYTNSGSTPTYGDFSNHGGTTRSQAQVIFLDGYKGIRNDPGNADTDFRIYDTRLSEDPDEGTNLAASPPAGQEVYFAELQQRMKDRVLRIRQPDASASRPYIDSTPVPPVTVPEVAPGVAWQGYEGLWPWVPEFRMETATASGTTTAPDLADLPAGPLDQGLLYTGYLSVPATGTWNFTITSDSGALLKIHDILVVDDDFNHDGSPSAGSVLLEAGLHPFRIYYRNRSTETPQLDITWSGPGVIAEPLPASALFIEGTPDPEPVGLDDAATSSVGTPVLLDVLANDLDDGAPQPLSLVSVSAPGGGTAVIQGDAILYTPDAGFAGIDGFTYTFTDGQFEAGATVSVTVNQPITDLWLPFNEGAGPIVYDAGGGYVGPITGDAGTWVASPNGTCLGFDGVDDHIPVDPANYTPPIGTSPRTITAWIQAPPAVLAPGLGSIVSWGSNGGANGNKWHWRLEGASPGTGTLRIEVKGGYLRGTTDLRDGEWHHVALVFPNGGSNVTDCLLYVDGVLESVGNSSAQAVATSLAGGLVIGKDDQGRHFEGLIDELRIGDEALSGGEIAAEAAAGPQVGAAWHARYFGAAAIDWDADDDGDGLSRLLEYGLAGQPLLPSPGPLPDFRLEGGEARFSFAKPLVHDLVFTFEESADLDDWDPFTPGLDSTDAGPLPGTEFLTYNLGPVTPTPRFVRLRVDLAP